MDGVGRSKSFQNQGLGKVSNSNPTNDEVKATKVRDGYRSSLKSTVRKSKGNLRQSNGTPPQSERPPIINYQLP